jgi:hypothetical protein
MKGSLLTKAIKYTKATTRLIAGLPGKLIGKLL